MNHGVGQLDLRLQGYWKNDKRSLQDSFIPAASPYGAWAIPLALYQSVGGMMSDNDIEYTPAYHLYDLCLTIAEESFHYDSDLSDDDDINGVCQLQERHRVFYNSKTSLEIEIEACEEGLNQIGSYSFEWIEFTERWSKFIENQFIYPSRLLNSTISWKITNQNNVCEDTSLIASKTENFYDFKFLFPENRSNCSKSSFHSNVIKKHSKTDQNSDFFDIWISTMNENEIDDSFSIVNKAIRSPSLLIGRFLDFFHISDEKLEFLDSLHQIWVPSNFLKSHFSNYVDFDKIHVIPSIIDLNLFDSEIIDDFTKKNIDSFIFFSKTDLLDSSNWKILLKSFFNEFNDESNTLLYLLVHLPSSSPERNSILSALRDEIDL